MTAESDTRRTVYYKATDAMPPYSMTGMANLQFHKASDGTMLVRAHPTIIENIRRGGSDIYIFKEMPDADDS